EQLGVDRMTVARWEAGESVPQPWQRPRIADAFGLSLCVLNQLLDEETPERAAEAPLVGRKVQDQLGMSRCTPPRESLWPSLSGPRPRM
ncbi:MAG: hypothetical protein ACRDQ9_16850, partial [Pseudonocardiaceae bacterium]